MFIFGQALLPPLIGAECENVEWLSHDGTNSPAVITCTVLSVESILAKKNQTSRMRRHLLTNVSEISPYICLKCVFRFDVL